MPVTSSHALPRCIAIDDELRNNVHHQICRECKVDSTPPALQAQLLPVSPQHHPHMRLSNHLNMVKLTSWTLFTGIAPCMAQERLTEPLRPNVAVLMPTRRPPESSNAPPELPPLMGASVCRREAHVLELPYRLPLDQRHLRMLGLLWGRVTIYVIYI